ncbi:MFS transporter [Archangium violaceum]|uniref:MFS transporter n=1 Tax=Archangium violaceum TaxID=83451 RepID=UPI002B31E1A2|nr:MFS transporter [Archangium violaceum]
MSSALEGSNAPLTRRAGSEARNERRFELFRWSIYAILALAYVWVYFHRMAPAVVSAELMSTFGTTASSLGFLSAVYFYIATATQIPSGVLADGLGTRLTVTVGNFAAGVGALLFGLAPSFQVAILGRFLVGLGVSVVFVCFMKSNAVWFSERRYGFVSGLTLLLGNLGSVLAAAPLAAALNLWSWRIVFVSIGVISLVLAGLSLVFIRNRPEDAGFLSAQEMEGQPALPQAQPGPRRSWSSDLRQVLGNRDVWPSFLINFGMVGSLYAFSGLWSLPLLRDLHGLSRNEAANYATWTLVGLGVGALPMGWLSDWLGVRKPVLLASVVAYCGAWLGLLFLPWSPGPSGMALFLLLGLAGSGFVLTYPCAKEVSLPALSGMAISVVNTGVFLGAALFQSLFGWVLDLGWQGVMDGELRVYPRGAYQSALFLMLGCAVLAVLAAFRLKETQCRNILSTRYDDRSGPTSNPSAV